MSFKDEIAKAKGTGGTSGSAFAAALKDISARVFTHPKLNLNRQKAEWGESDVREAELRSLGQERIAGSKSMVMEGDHEAWCEFWIDVTGTKMPVKITAYPIGNGPRFRFDVEGVLVMPDNDFDAACTTIADTLKEKARRLGR